MIILLVPAQVSLCAQDSVAVRWDELLDRYERICNMCLELKGDAARNIPAGKMDSLLGELNGLREELAQSGSRMPVAARLRFGTIRSMYAAGLKADTRKPDFTVSMPELVDRPPAKAPAYGVVGSYNVPPVGGIEYKWVVNASAVALPEFSVGVMAGYVPGKIGAYAAFRSNYSFHRAAYSALSDGTSAAGPVWTSGRTAVDRFFVTAGPVVRLPYHFAVFAGLGYGMRRLCWEDSEGAWMEVSDASRMGLCIELGVSYRIGRLTLGSSWLSLPFGYNAMTVSAGWSFGPYSE